MNAPNRIDPFNDFVTIDGVRHAQLGERAACSADGSGTSRPRPPGPRAGL